MMKLFKIFTMVANNQLNFNLMINKTNQEPLVTILSLFRVKELFRCKLVYIRDCLEIRLGQVNSY